MRRLAFNPKDDSVPVPSKTQALKRPDSLSLGFTVKDSDFQMWLRVLGQELEGQAVFEDLWVSNRPTAFGVCFWF